MSDVVWNSKGEMLKALKMRDERIEELESRLEIYPINIKTGKPDYDKALPESCDGIACRDETIKLQDKRIEELEVTIEKLAEQAANDAEEIGSYLLRTGLRGEYRAQGKRIEELEAEIQCKEDARRFYKAAMNQLEDDFERLRAALERIADRITGEPESAWVANNALAAVQETDDE